MHFSDNDDPRKDTDRIWKIRPIVDVLEDTFKRGYNPGPFLSFDEGMLPSHSRYNTTRMYLKDKPHKWGTKMFLTCCARTSYCHRLEIYCGKKSYEDTGQVDTKAGPSAVLRNLMKVLPPKRSNYHVVGMDRFYTSIPLFLELLSRRVYAVGTIQTNRIGFPDFLKETRKKRPETIRRGSYCIARSRTAPDLLACCWWDNKPVHLLATRSSTQQLSIVRRKRQTRENVPCPKLVIDYQKNMGGVDVFDQLRLQRYSVQTAHRFQKYYKSLALGLFDCALVNAFIIHREHHRKRGTTGMEHGGFLVAVQSHLVQMTKETFPAQTATSSNDARYRVAPPRRYLDTDNHEMTLTNDFHEATDTQPRKRMARTCKVCSILAPPGKRAASTPTYCKVCSQSVSGDVYLCQKARHPSFGVTKSCFQIWHQDWNGGKNLPAGSAQKIRYRPPTGKKRKTRQFEIQE